MDYRLLEERIVLDYMTLQKLLRGYRRLREGFSLLEDDILQASRGYQGFAKPAAFTFSTTLPRPQCAKTYRNTKI